MTQELPTSRWLLLVVSLLGVSGCASFHMTETVTDGSSPKATREIKVTGGLFDIQALPVLTSITADKRGATTGTTSWMENFANSMKPLYVIGGIAIVAGAVSLAVFKAWLTGSSVIAAGIFIIAYARVAATHGWLIFIGLLLAAGLGAWYLIRTRVGARTAKALLETVKGVETFHGKEGWKELKADLRTAQKPDTVLYLDELRAKVKKSAEATVAPESSA